MSMGAAALRRGRSVKYAVAAAGDRAACAHGTCGHSRVFGKDKQTQWEEAVRKTIKKGNSYESDETEN